MTYLVFSGSTVIEVNAEHPENAAPEILVTLAGIAISQIDVQSANAQPPIDKRPSERVTVSIDLQPLKADSPIADALVTVTLLRDFGIGEYSSRKKYPIRVAEEALLPTNGTVSVFSEVHPENAPIPIEDTPEPTVTRTREVQPENAYSPTELTDSPITTLVIDVIPENAPFGTDPLPIISTVLRVEGT